MVPFAKMCIGKKNKKRLDIQGNVYKDCNAVVVNVPLSNIKPQFIGAPVLEQGTGQLLAAVTLQNGMSRRMGC